MRVRRLAVVFALLLAAGSTGRALGASGSFIDLDDDGVFDPGDLPLENYLGPDSWGFDAYIPQPGYTPSTRPIGLVIEGTLTLGASDLVSVVVTGAIRVRGNVVVQRGDVMASFTTVGGDIDIAPGVRLDGRGDLMFEAARGGDVRVGDGVRFSTRGDFALVGVKADGTVTLGKEVELRLRSNGYSTAFVQGADGVLGGAGLTFRAPGHGTLLFLSGTDFSLANLNAKGGYLHLEAYSDARHPAAKRVHLVDSILQQTYRNGDFRIIAGADQRTNRFAPDAIVLERTTVRTVAAPLYVPDPVIR